MREIKYICAECGCTYENPDNGLCPYGHDNWMENNDFCSILPFQAELFERQLGLSISIAFQVFLGNPFATIKLFNAHIEWCRRNGVEPINEITLAMKTLQKNFVL